MKLQGNITIGRDSSDTINISIEDKNSMGRFVSAKMTLTDFAMALTGLGHVPVELDVRGLEHVGKVREREDRSIKYPLPSGSREVMQQWLIANAQEAGWILDPYLGSQRSVSYGDGFTMLNYAVYRFVEQPAQAGEGDKHGND